MASSTEGKVIGDIVKAELPMHGSRRELTVTESQTLVLGQLCAKGASGRMQAIGAVANEVQLLAVDTAASGDFRLGIPQPDGGIVWTSVIAWNASTANIQTALDTTPFGTSVIAAGTAVSASTFTFSGVPYAGQGWPMIEMDAGNLGSSDVSMTRTTAGGTAVAAVDEVQTATATLTPDGGTWVLYFPHPNGTTLHTTALAHGANAAAIEAAIEVATAAATPAVNADAIKVAGTNLVTGDITLTFSGEEYEGRDWPLATVDAALLLDGAVVCSVTFAETTKGGTAGGGEAEAIILEAVTTAGGAYQDAAFLVRTATVDVDQLTFGANANRVDSIEQLESRGIACLSEPE